MNEIAWVSREVALAIHAEQIAEHGGLRGVRDEGLLDSALSRPQLEAKYGEEDVVALAAPYAFGIARNHAFLDGNKRTAYVVMELFLLKNGLRLLGSDAEAVVTFLGLAAGEIDEEQLAGWIRSNVEPTSDR